MKRSRVVRLLVVAPSCALLAFASVRAEDTKGKWQFGFGLSYFSTVDYIRSNADVAIATGLAGDDGLPTVTFVDPRPDANILNRPGVQDDFKLDFNVSYGLTRWLAVELAASYLKAPVGNIEVFSIDISKDVNVGVPNTQRDSRNRLKFCGPEGADLCFNYNGDNIPSRSESNGFLEVGELTEIPIQLSALVRFRPESPFDPYVGLGIGYIMTDLKTGDNFEAQAKEVSELLVQAPILGNAVADPAFTAPFPGVTPGPLEAEVNDAFEYHVVGGVDYYLSERFSMFVDARYVWTSGSVDIRIWDAQQGLLASTELGKLRSIQRGLLEDRDGDGEFDPDLFVLWEDLGTEDNVAFHNRCSTAKDADGKDTPCQGSGRFEMDDFNGNGQYESDTEGTGRLLQLPPGSADPDEALGEIFCPGCKTVDHGGPLPVPPLYPGSATIRLPANTEDTNFSRSLDRFMRFGVDCSTVDAAAFPECAGIRQIKFDFPQFVWPDGCPQLPPDRPLADTTRALQEGCPVPRRTSVNATGVDNVSDTLLIQGGQIRLGGFALGVGVKFTF